MHPIGSPPLRLVPGLPHNVLWIVFCLPPLVALFAGKDCRNKLCLLSSFYPLKAISTFARSPQPDAAGLDGAVGKRIHAAFADSTARGLLHLATTELQSSLPPPLGFARDFARLYLTRLCQTPVDGESGKVPPIQPPSESDLAFQVLQAPPMQGWNT